MAEAEALRAKLEREKQELRDFLEQGGVKILRCYGIPKNNCNNTTSYIYMYIYSFQ